MFGSLHLWGWEGHSTWFVLRGRYTRYSTVLAVQLDMEEALRSGKVWLWDIVLTLELETQN